MLRYIVMTKLSDVYKNALFFVQYMTILFYWTHSYCFILKYSYVNQTCDLKPTHNRQPREQFFREGDS